MYHSKQWFMKPGAMMAAPKPSDQKMFKSVSWVSMALLAVSASAGQSTNFRMPGAGDVKIRYGTPLWRDAFLSQVRPGLSWRLGANGATTLETTAALVWKEGVIFPGTYNLGAEFRSSTAWELVFHADGNFYRGGRRWGRFKLVQTDASTPREHAKKLQIELAATRGKEAKRARRATFAVRFGPKRLEAPVQVVGVGKKRAKAGKTSYVLRWARHPQTPELESRLGGEGKDRLIIGHLLVPKTKKRLRDLETLVALVPGEKPRLRLPDFDREIVGTRSERSSKAKVLDVAIQKELVVKIGKLLFTFPWSESALGPAPKGGTTPR